MLCLIQCQCTPALSHRMLTFTHKFGCWTPYVATSRKKLSTPRRYHPAVADPARWFASPVRHLLYVQENHPSSPPSEWLLATSAGALAASDLCEENRPELAIRFLQSKPCTAPPAFLPPAWVNEKSATPPPNQWPDRLRSHRPRPIARS